MCNLSEAVAEKATIEATEKTNAKVVDAFSRALALYSSGERNKDVYRENGIAEDVIKTVFENMQTQRQLK